MRLKEIVIWGTSRTVHVLATSKPGYVDVWIDQGDSGRYWMRDARVRGPAGRIVLARSILHQANNGNDDVEERELADLLARIASLPSERKV
jgi:hypothetical protein